MSKETPQVIQVIKTVIPRGDGKATRFRWVKQFHDFEGNFLGEDDPAICELCKKKGLIYSECSSSHK